MQIKVIIVGLGNVGRRLLELLDRKTELLLRRFDLEFLVVAVADSSGGRLLDEPGNLLPLIELKHKGGRLSDRGPTIEPGELIARTDADLLVELSPTNLKTGEPGISLIRAAIAKRMAAVTANKGPLVLAYDELTRAAVKNGVRLLYSATVTGGLPTLNVGRRDLGACEFTGFEGIVNATTNYILTRMSEGETFESSLKHAQEAGHAEADPSLDVDGWDAANKLVIVANAVLMRPTRLDEIKVVGIRGVTQDDLRQAKAKGNVIKLVAKAERSDGDWRFSVQPSELDTTHSLAGINGEMMGVIYRTDINGTMFLSIEERDPYPTAAAVLRDMVDASLAR